VDDNYNGIDSGVIVADKKDNVTDCRNNDKDNDNDNNDNDIITPSIDIDNTATDGTNNNKTNGSDSSNSCCESSGHSSIEDIKLDSSTNTSTNTSASIEPPHVEPSDEGDINDACDGAAAAAADDDDTRGCSPVHPPLISAEIAGMVIDMVSADETVSGGAGGAGTGGAGAGGSGKGEGEVEGSGKGDDGENEGDADAVMGRVEGGVDGLSLRSSDAYDTWGGTWAEGERPLSDGQGQINSKECTKAEAEGAEGYKHARDESENDDAKAPNGVGPKRPSLTPLIPRSAAAIESIESSYEVYFELLADKDLMCRAYDLKEVIVMCDRVT
jgi:hypothetical protein